MMKNFDLKTAWGVHRKKGEHIQFHKHDFYELVYYCSGSGKGCLAKDSYVFSPESFVLIPPYAKHDELLYLDSDVLCIGFTTDEAFAFGQYADAQGRICRIARAIMQEVIEQPALYKDMILAKGVELLIEIRRLERPHSHYTTKNFEYIINYIAQNYHEKLMLKDMAQQMHISYDYFQHRFKEIVGESPQQFLVRKRGEAAEGLLADGTLSCTEIAYQCGFSNSAQFSAIFKREKGITPRQYQQAGKVR